MREFVIVDEGAEADGVGSSRACPGSQGAEGVDLVQPVRLSEVQDGTYLYQRHRLQQEGVEGCAVVDDAAPSVERPVIAQSVRLGQRRWHFVAIASCVARGSPSPAILQRLPPLLDLALDLCKRVAMARPVGYDCHANEALVAFISRRQAPYFVAANAGFCRGRRRGWAADGSSGDTQILGQLSDRFIISGECIVRDGPQDIHEAGDQMFA